MANWIDIWHFGVALALGFVVGLQRENAASPDRSSLLGGVRTFPVVAILGCVTSFIGIQGGTSLPFALGFLVVGGILAATQFAKVQEGHVGMTTAMALLLIYAVGGLCANGQLVLATAVSVILAILLTLKMELHQFAHRISQHDLIASLKFAVISAIVLPLLPDQNFGPDAFQIFNPFKIWLLVVFISGISFIGYILVKLVGADRGIGLTGILGGLASSTALTINFTHRSRENPQLSSTLATGIVVAWTVMYARVLGIVWVISPALGSSMTIPMLVPVIPGLAWCVWLWKREKQSSGQTAPKFANPFEIVPALKFVGILLLVLLASKAARLEFGDSGLLISSFIAGLADVDAIAISVAQMVSQEQSSFVRLATIAAVLAGIANTITKGSIALVMGAPAMRRAIGPAMGLMLVSGVIAILLIPG